MEATETLLQRNTWRDVIAVSLLGGSAIAALGTLRTLGNVHYLPLLERLPSPFGLTCLTAVGAGCILAIYRAQDWSRAPAASCLIDVLKSALWLIALCGVVTLTDVVVRYPRDLNVAEPWALLFYPSMGVLAEIAFHIIPLAVLLLLAAWQLPSLDPRPRAAIIVSIVALIEPIFQSVVDHSSAARAAITFANIYTFNIIQLQLFRRYGFLPMLTYRLCYYAWWHIIWGTLRLHILF